MKTVLTKVFSFLCLLLLTSQAFSQIATQITQRGTYTTATSGSGTLTINKPTGVVAGDLLIANIVQNDATNNNLDNVAIPTGWVLIDGRSIYDLNGSGGNPDKEWWGTLLYKIATGTEGANYAFTLDNGAEMAIGSIVAFSGVDVSNGPFDVAPGSLNLTNAGTATASAISNISSNAAIVMFAQVANNRTYSNWAATAPSTFTELYENTTTNSDDASVGAAWAIKSSTGSTGNATVTLSGSGRNAAILIALKPLSYSSAAIGGTITQRGTYTTATSGSGTLTINKPTGVVAGDLLIANIVQNDATNNNLDNVAIPTGWVLIDGRSIYDLNGSGGNPDKEWWGTLLYKIATGTEGANYAFTLDNAAEMAIGSIVAFSGVDVSNGPFDVAPGSLNLTNAGTATASAISNISSNAAIVMFAQVANDRTYSNWAATAPSTFTELYENTTTNSDDASVGAAWAIKSSTGSTGNATVTLSGSDRNAAILIALKPIPVSPYKYYNGSYGATQSNSNTTNVSVVNKTIPLSASYFNVSNVKKVSIIFESANTISNIYADKDGNGLFNVSSTTDYALVNNTDYVIETISTGVYKITINLPVITSGSSLYNLFIQSTASSSFFMDQLTLAAAALPVTLTSFTAKPTSTNTVALNWATSSEIVNKGFRIERQAGGMNGKFESLGFVASKANGGNSQTALYYSFIDASPRSGATAYYRLAQEDLDGKTTFSEVRVVKFSGETVSMVYPNPSNGAVNISRTATGKKMNVQVIDMAGRMVQQFTNITDSNFKLNINKSGMYNIKMTYPESGEQSVQRIVIER